MTDAKSKILEALASVTPADLAAVEGEIEAIKAEAAKKVGGLYAVRAVMQRTLGVETKDQRRDRLKREAKGRAAEKDAKSANGGASSHKGRPPSDETVSQRKTAAVLIHREGAMQPAALQTILGVAPSRLEVLMKHEWFGHSANGYHLTPQGRQANC